MITIVVKSSVEEIEPEPRADKTYLAWQLITVLPLRVYNA